MRHPLRLALASTLLASSAVAGGWTQPEGAHYLKVWDRTVAGSGVFAANGETFKLDDSYLDTSLQLYGEYGLTDTVTLVTYLVPVGHSKIGDESTNYVGPLTLGLRKGFSLGRSKVAVEAQYGYTPDIGTETLASGIAEDNAYVYVANVSTQRASAELQFGHPLSFGWVTASAGYRYFTEDALDPVIYGFGQIGWNVSKSWVLDFHVNLYEPLGDVEITEVLGVGQTRYLGNGIGASYWMTEHLAITSSFEGAFYAESNAATPSLVIGLEAK